METRLLLWIHAWSSPWLDALFLFSHQLGTLSFCAALVLAAAGWCYRRGERREAGLWIGLGLSTFLLQEGLKLLFERERPRLWTWAIPQSNLSFPSGHALATATFYPLLARTLVRQGLCPPGLAYGMAAGLAVFVGIGRLYLGLHWPTDVLAGWLVGAAQTALAVSWSDRRAPGPHLPPS